MNTKRNIIIALVILLALAASIVFYKQRAEAPLAVQTASSTPVYGNEVFDQNETRIKTNEDKRVAHLAWTTFEKYVAFAKAHDIQGIKSLSRELSPTCSDPSKVKDCNLLMDDIAAVGAIFSEKDFTHILYDDKQIILSTDFKREDYSQLRGYTRTVIYFTRNAEGNPLITGFGPTQGRYLAKLSKQTDTELEKALTLRLVDTDKDGLPDFVEACKEIEKDKVCTPTDPNKRDTNGNGYWDGIEIFFRK